MATVYVPLGLIGKTAAVESRTVGKTRAIIAFAPQSQPDLDVDTYVGSDAAVGSDAVGTISELVNAVAYVPLGITARNTPNYNAVAFAPVKIISRAAGTKIGGAPGKVVFYPASRSNRHICDVPIDGKANLKVTEAPVDPPVIAPTPSAGPVVNPEGSSPWIRRNSETYAGPTLTDGRPDSEWQPSSVTTEVWGRVRVLINGSDYTYYRNGRAQINNVTIAEPFGDAACAITLPAITPFDDPASHAPKYAEVEIQRVKENGNTENLWSGSVSSWESSTEGLSIQCTGAFYEADRFLRLPAMWARLDYVENHITQTLNFYITFYDLNLAILEWTYTGALLRSRGAYEKVATGYIAELIAQAQRDGKQFTIECKNRKPRFREKDMTTTHWTVQTGGRGIDHSISADHLEGKANQFYAEGTDENNCHWRGTRYMHDYSSSFVWPIVSTLQTESRKPIVKSPAAEDYHKIYGWTAEPLYDPDFPRIEQYQNFGTGTPLEVATEYGTDLLSRWYNDGWLGSITLTSDPEEGSRFEIRAGENILMKDFHGSDVLFHVVEVSHDFTNLTTSLTVDTESRDRMDVVAIHKRMSEARESPHAKLNLGRRSKQTEDRIAVWDCESGAGYIEDLPLQAGYFTMWPILAGEVGQVVRSEFWRLPYAGSLTTWPLEFEVQIFDREINLWDLHNIGIPPDDDSYWEDERLEWLYDQGLLIGWQGCGYWPNAKDDEPPEGYDEMPKTGFFRDDASWYYMCRTPPFLWIVASTQESGVFGGRLYPSGEYSIA